MARRPTRRRSSQLPRCPPRSATRRRYRTRPVHQGRHRSTLDDATFPAILPLANHLTIDGDVRDARVAGLLRSLTLRLVAAHPAGTIRIRTVDATGAAFGTFRDLVPVGLMSAPVADRDGLRRVLTEGRGVGARSEPSTLSRADDRVVPPVRGSGRVRPHRGSSPTWARPAACIWSSRAGRPRRSSACRRSPARRIHLPDHYLPAHHHPAPQRRANPPASPPRRPVARTSRPHAPGPASRQCRPRHTATHHGHPATGNRNRNRNRNPATRRLDYAAQPVAILGSPPSESFGTMGSLNSPVYLDPRSARGHHPLRLRAGRRASQRERVDTRRAAAGPTVAGELGGRPRRSRRSRR